MTTTRFRTDNTEGYSASDLADLNTEFERRTFDISEDDENYRDHIAESVLVWFDYSKAARNPD